MTTKRRRPRPEVLTAVIPPVSAYGSKETAPIVCPGCNRTLTVALRGAQAWCRVCWEWTPS